MAISHANCGHPSTPAARAICRKNQAKIAGGEISAEKQKKAPALQVALTTSYRDSLLELAGTTVAKIREKLNLTEVDLADIDLWFEREMPEMLRLVKAEHKAGAILTAQYMRRHAAISGYMSALQPAEVIEEQLVKSLTVTGPGAFKKHVGMGGTAEEALEVMQTTLPGSAERLAMTGARDTLTDAVENSESPVLGYTRRTSGKACAYCQGLSREPVYAGSDGVKTFHAHDHCTCSGEPFYLDDDRKAVNRLTEAEQFSEQFAQLRKASDEAWDKLITRMNDNDPDYAAFGFYTIDSGPFNRLLRNGDEGDMSLLHQALSFDDISPEDFSIQDQVDEIFSRLKKEKLKGDVAAWRGMVDGSNVFGKDRWDGNLEGLEWIDDGFTSTSLDEHTAKIFAGGYSQDPEDRRPIQAVLLNLIVRQGTKGVTIEGEAGFEFELLLQAGTKFKVIKDHGYGEYGMRILDVEVLP